VDFSTFVIQEANRGRVESSKDLNDDIDLSWMILRWRDATNLRAGDSCC